MAHFENLGFPGLGQATSEKVELFSLRKVCLKNLDFPEPGYTILKILNFMASLWLILKILAFPGLDRLILNILNFLALGRFILQKS